MMSRLLAVLLPLLAAAAVLAACGSASDKAPAPLALANPAGLQARAPGTVGCFDPAEISVKIGMTRCNAPDVQITNEEAVRFDRGFASDRISALYAAASRNAALHRCLDPQQRLYYARRSRCAEGDQELSRADYERAKGWDFSTGALLRVGDSLASGGGNGVVAAANPAAALAPASTQTPKLVVPAVSGVPASPASPPSALRLDRAELVRRIERATVFVISKGGAGTGFFVNPNTVVTNAHVVGATPVGGEVVLTSKFFVQAVVGKVIAVTAPDPQLPSSVDLAFIRLDLVKPAPYLPLAMTAEPLDPIVAAGYPGTAIRLDDGLLKLIKGDVHAAPDVVLRTGEIISVQHAGSPHILHSAVTIEGNSGGPLVDHCGRVLGINTAYSQDRQGQGRVYISQHSQAIAIYALKADVALTVNRSKCEAE